MSNNALSGSISQSYYEENRYTTWKNIPENKLSVAFPVSQTTTEK